MQAWQEELLCHLTGLQQQKTHAAAGAMMTTFLPEVVPQSSVLGSGALLRTTQNSNLALLLLYLTLNCTLPKHPSKTLFACL